MSKLHPFRQQRPAPLAQVEVLICFSPGMQSGGAGKPTPAAFSTATTGWMTVDVFGTPARSDITHKPVLEDMRLLTADGEDVEPYLPEQVINAIADYALDL